MPKAYSLQKDFKRFTASNQFNLVALQAFTFGLYNARLKLKQDKIRYNDILTVFIVGELQQQGCKVSEFGQILGYNLSTSRNALKRAANRCLVYYYGGKPGRGKATIFSLTMKGQRVYDTLQIEMGKTLNEAKKLFDREMYNTIIRERLTC